MRDRERLRETGQHKEPARDRRRRERQRETERQRDTERDVERQRDTERDSFATKFLFAFKRLAPSSVYISMCIYIYITHDGDDVLSLAR